MCKSRRARGTVAVVAMMCLVFFGLLCAGMASMSMSSVQLTKNTRSLNRAFLSAESGLEYLKYVLSEPAQVIPAGIPDSGVLTKLQENLTHYYLGTSVRPQLSGTKLYLPAAADPPIAIGELRFRTEITTYTDPATGQLRLSAKSIGQDLGSGVTHTISALFDPNGPTESAFDFGVFSRGGICQSGGGSVLGNPAYARCMSTLASGIAYNMSGGSQIAGMAFTAASPVSGSNVKYSGSAGVNGLTTSSTSFFSNGFQQKTPPPDPVFDPTDIAKRVALSSPPLTSSWRNVRIPANYTGNTSGLTLQGLIYIESPNNITFSTCSIDAVIVFAPSTTGVPDTLKLSSSQRFGPIPNGTAFDTAREATQGYAILAPTANVTASGSMGSSTNPVGSIICNRLAFSGGVEVNIHNGSIIVFDKTAATSGAAAACNLSGASAINFTRTNFVPPPHGFSNPGEKKYTLDPASYTEAS